MKPEFFVVAFAMLFLGVYLTHSGRFYHREKSNYMKIISNGSIEELSYTGTIELNDSGTDFKSISRGGYVEYEKNDSKLVAKGSSTGEIAYEFFEDGEKTPLDKKLLAEAVSEMIAWGFDAETIGNDADYGKAMRAIE